MATSLRTAALCWMGRRPTWRRTRTSRSFISASRRPDANRFATSSIIAAGNVGWLDRVVSEHFDTLETRDPELREQAQLAALPVRIALATSHTAAYARIFSGVDPAAVTTRAALARLPVTRKTELLELQK